MSITRLTLIVGLALSAMTTTAFAKGDNLTSDYCKQVADLMLKLDTLEKIEPQTKMSDARASFQKVEKQVRELRETSRALVERGEQRIQRAQERLLAAVRNVPDEATVGQGRRIVEPELEALRRAQEQAIADLSCGEE